MGHSNALVAEAGDVLAAELDAVRKPTVVLIPVQRSASKWL